MFLSAIALLSLIVAPGPTAHAAGHPAHAAGPTAHAATLAAPAAVHPARAAIHHAPAAIHPANAAAHPTSAFGRIAPSLEATAYEPHADDSQGTITLFNPAQNLRVEFHDTGMSVEATGRALHWTSLALGRPGSMTHLPAVGAATHTGPDEATPTRVIYVRGPIVEWYENSPDGLEQGFTLASRPAGTGPLRLEGRIEGDAAAAGLTASFDPHDESIELVDAGGRCWLRYSKLLAYDARGRRLPSKLDLVESRGARGGVAVEADRDAKEACACTIRISVDDTDAAYPITIDPLLNSPAWMQEGNQNSAFYGNAIGTAGDVNADGYSDVLVGAVLYNNGQTDEGRVYLYLGSAAGLAVAPAWTAESNQDGARFGESVAAAGDVNGDGYDDVVIGASYYDNGQADEGRAYVYYGTATGLDASPAWTGESNASSGNYGISVAGAGDVNADGYADILIGAFGLDNGDTNEGRAYLYLGSANGVGANPVWTYESNTFDYGLGYSVSTAGDVNGDGYDDILIGSFPGGEAFVFHGNANGVNATPSWVENGDGSGAFGQSVSTAGDVNGDGYSDVIVGAPFYNGGQATEGKVYVYHGGAAGLGAAPAWTEEINQAGAAFGWWVAVAGDCDGNGYSDVVIGAPYYTDDQDSEGRAYLYQGGPAGLGTSHAWLANGNQVDCRFGGTVACAGDVSGDGHADVLVGSPYWDNDQLQEGRVYLYHGIPGDLPSLSSWVDEGDQASAGYGTSLASLGDVNGDGFGDIAVGAWFFDNGQADEGRIFAYYGGRAGPSSTPSWTAESNQTTALFGFSIDGAGDVNGDGYDDLIAGSTLYDGWAANVGRAFVYLGAAGGLAAAPAWMVDGDQAGGWFSWSLSSAGDVNGDGYGDVIVGAPRYTNGEVEEGRIYLFLGSATGLATTPAWTYESNQTNAGLGFDVDCAGDVNGDGYSDIIAGAVDYTNGELEEGAAFVFFGSPSGPGMRPDWSAESNQSFASFGLAVAGAGDVNGDGYSDVIVGDPAFDITFTDEGKVSVFLGSPGGLPAAPAWTRFGLQETARLGEDVATAGDVNGDGRSDILLGAPYFDNGLNDEGQAYLFLGTAAGPGTVIAWVADGAQADARFGSALAGACDTNGDGFSDVAVGAPDYSNGQVGEGRALLYFGNEGDGIDRLPRQVDPADLGPLALLGRSGSPSSFFHYVRLRTPAGRDRVYFEAEAKPLGVPFDGTGLVIGDPADTGSPIPGEGSWREDRELADGLTADTPYHWRVRLRSRSPFFPRSPWLSLAGNCATETDLRTGAIASDVADAGARTRLFLAEPRPNPAADRTSISFVLPEAGEATLVVCDVLGRRVATLASGRHETGLHEIRWEGRNDAGRPLVSGVYFLRLEAGGRTETQKLLWRR